MSILVPDAISAGGFTIPVSPASFTTSNPNTQVADQVPGLDTRVPVNPRFGATNPRSFTSIGAKGAHDNYFERVYVTPDRVNAGDIVSVQVVVVSVFNAFRKSSISWTDYDDTSAGAGVDLTNPAPPPPTQQVLPLFGSTHDLTISATGDPTIDGTLDFTFTIPSGSLIILVPITGSRSTLFPFQPEQPFMEVIEFFTLIGRARTGKEQRSSMRKNPRHLFEPRYLTDEIERARMDAYFFSSQAAKIPFPLHIEASKLTSPVTGGDLTINVTDTTFARFKVGGLVAVWEDSETFETLQIDALATNTITVTSVFTGAFSTGALVMPVVVTISPEEVNKSHYTVDLHENQIRLTVVENDLDLSDVTSFSSYTPTGGSTRVFLDTDNFSRGDRVSESWDRPVAVIDNRVGSPDIYSRQAVSRLRSQRGFFTRNRQELRDLRGLLHDLDGRRKAWYMPAYNDDIVLAVDINLADQAIQIEDSDFAKSIQQRGAIRDFRIVLNDETVVGPFRITGSTAPVAGIETISIAPATIGQNIAISDVSRIEFVRRVRFDTDRFEIEHQDSNGRAFMTVPVIDDLNEDD